MNDGSDDNDDADGCWVAKEERNEVEGKEIFCVLFLRVRRNFIMKR